MNPEQQQTIKTHVEAIVAYKSAAQDIEYITGITVPAKTQQRLVHYQEFDLPVATVEISELSADGGKARLITPKGEKSEWKDYKAIVSEVGIVASTIHRIKEKSAVNFCKYLEKHKERIINYEVFQRDKICSIGSGAVESGIKQIARRIKISGASWKTENIGQVLAHRCAYLNGLIGKPQKVA